MTALLCPIYTHRREAANVIEYHFKSCHDSCDCFKIDTESSSILISTQQRCQGCRNENLPPNKPNDLMQTLVEGCPLDCILCSHNGFSPAKASFVCSTPVHSHIRLTPTHLATSNELAMKTRNLDYLRQNLSQTFSSEENSNSLQPLHYLISVTPEQGVQ
jgi:hypothetical protein